MRSLLAEDFFVLDIHLLAILCLGYAVLLNNLKFICKVHLIFICSDEVPVSQLG